MTPVERAARAMCRRSIGVDDGVVSPGLEAYLDANWRRIAGDARAAIASLREPSEAMKLAGARSIGKSMGETNHMQRALECCQAMIDAALAEGDAADAGG